MGSFFMEPLWLLPLVVVLAAIYFLIKKSKKEKKKAAVKFSNINLIKMASAHQKTKRRSKIILAIDILLVLSLFLALADPHCVRTADGSGSGRDHVEIRGKRLAAVPAGFRGLRH